MTAADSPYDPLLVADIEDIFSPDDHDDLTTAAEVTTTAGQWSADTLSFTHPEIYDAVEDLFNAIDPVTYLINVINSLRPDDAQQAFEQMVTGEWDGDLS